MINSNEGRYVGMVNITNAFIQTKDENEEDKVPIKLRGKLSEYLVMVALDNYIPYVLIEKGRGGVILSSTKRNLRNIERSVFIL